MSNQPIPRVATHRSVASWFVAGCAGTSPVLVLLTHQPWWFGATAGVLALVRYDGAATFEWCRLAWSFLSGSRAQWWSANSVTRQTQTQTGRRDLSSQPDRFTDTIGAALGRAARVRGGWIALYGSTPDESLMWCTSGVTVEGVVMPPVATAMWVLERWRYVRVGDEVARALAVSDVEAAPATWLGDLVAQSHCQYAIHTRVYEQHVARRQAARRRHRAEVATAFRSLWGWRTTATSARLLESARQMEQAVAHGDAICDSIVLVGVRAPDLASLQVRVAAVVRAAETAGIRLVRGAGRQGRWIRALEPGGTVW